MLISSRSRFALVLSAGAIAAAMAWAATADEPRGKAASKASPQGAGQANSQLATWLAIENEGEIALAKMAQERSQNDQVKDFAQTMVDEHTQFLSKLQQYAGEGSTGSRPIRTIREDDPADRSSSDRNPADRNPADRNPSDPDSADRDPTDLDPEVRDTPAEREESREGVNRDDPSRTVGKPRTGHAGGIDFISLKKELGEQCLQTAQQELQQKEGAEFDKCYMTQQLMAHVHMVDTLTVFKNHASGDFEQLLDEGVKTAEKHLAHAKGLVKELEDSPATARKAASKSE